MELQGFLKQRKQKKEYLRQQRGIMRYLYLGGKLTGIMADMKFKINGDLRARALRLKSQGYPIKWEKHNNDWRYYAECNYVDDVEGLDYSFIK